MPTHPTPSWIPGHRVGIFCGVCAGEGAGVCVGRDVCAERVGAGCAARRRAGGAASVCFARSSFVDSDVLWVVVLGVEDRAQLRRICGSTSPCFRFVEWARSACFWCQIEVREWRRAALPCSVSITLVRGAHYRSMPGSRRHMVDAASRHTGQRRQWQRICCARRVGGAVRRRDGGQWQEHGRR